MKFRRARAKRAAKRRVHADNLGDYLDGLSYDQLVALDSIFPDTSFARIILPNGEEARLSFTNPSNGIIERSGVSSVLAYWESRFEIFCWACESLGYNPEQCEWMDSETGEILDY